MQILEQSWWETVLVYHMVFLYEWCFWAGPTEKNVGLPSCVSMGCASEVVPAGYSDGLPVGMVVG
eukprot:1358328-Ditylum_brightwellii.AAC.1